MFYDIVFVDLFFVKLLVVFMLVVLEDNKFVYSGSVVYLEYESVLIIFVFFVYW